MTAARVDCSLIYVKVDRRHWLRTVGLCTSAGQGDGVTPNVAHGVRTRYFVDSTIPPHQIEL